MTTNTTGTGTMTLVAADATWLSFAAAGAVDGATYSYSIEDGTNREVGRGVYNATAGTLTRGLVKSTTGALLNLSGSAKVSIDALADDIYRDWELIGSANQASFTSAVTINNIPQNYADIRIVGQQLRQDASGSTTALRCELSNNGSSFSSPRSVGLNITSNTEWYADTEIEIPGYRGDRFFIKGKSCWKLSADIGNLEAYGGYIYNSAFPYDFYRVDGGVKHARLSWSNGIWIKGQFYVYGR